MAEQNKRKQRKKKIATVSNAKAEPTSSDQSEAVDIKPEIKNMEVHHHSHESHGKKSWKNYFWEFLMLFLAVFCGFLAEYQLEHKIERDRASELAKSFYEELKGDSATAALKVQNRIKQENALLYCMKYFKDSSLTNVSKGFQLNFLYGVLFRTPSVFEPRTVVLDQLKNSGSLRYFKNEEFQKLVGDLSVAIHNFQDRQKLESDVRIANLNPLIIRIHDYDFEEKLCDGDKKTVFQGAQDYESNNEFIPFQIRHPDKFERDNIVNTLGFYCRNGMRSTRQVHIQNYINANTQLLKVLREEYHLE